ncbi:large subunit ribosomal protein L31e [Nematocida sp. AWRm80]|nr:large subunit ribosomal protein L31e [Nematocida sp. AWRm80]
MANIADENKVIVFTVNLWRLVKNCSQVRWADCAVRNLKKEVQKQYGPGLQVKMDMGLNKAIWIRGKKKLPPKIRVEVSRRPSSTDGSKTELYLRHVAVANFKGLQCESQVIHDHAQ